MKTEHDPGCAAGNSGDSAGQQTVAEMERDNGGPDSAPPESQSSELLQAMLKAMYYWVLSRF